MITAEISRLQTTFRDRAAAAKAEGNTEARIAWEQAAALLIDAEGKSIAASFERSQKRRKLGLRLTR